jgi:hypothetical protein
LEDSKLWNNTIGIDLSYAQNMVVRDVSVIHTPGAWPQTGIAHNAITGNVEFDNVTVTGYAWGIDVPRLGYTIINGGYFANKYDIVVQTGLSGNRNVLITGPIVLGALGLQNQAQIYMRTNLAPQGDWAGYFFSTDIVTANFGPYINKRLYSTLQQATAVPVPTPIPGVSTDYVGLTNQQLWDYYRIALGGEIAPGNAYMPFGIIGLVAP